MKLKQIILSLFFLAFGVVAFGADYTHSAGVSLGGFNGITYKGFIFGIDGLALQADLGVRVSAMGVPGDTHVRFAGHHDIDFSIKKDYTLIYYTFEANPNIIYQQAFANTSWGLFSWMAGGGVSIGFADASTKWKYLNQTLHITTITDGSGNVTYSDTEYKRKEKYDPMFKFGFNAIGGIETSFASAPLTLTVEFRMGYGLMTQFSEAGEWDDQFGIPQMYPSKDTFSFFDWALGASLRYRF